MRVILLQDIPKVGKKWEEKNVSDGFAQNSLIPRKLAEAATKQAAARAAAARAAEDLRRNATSTEEIVRNFPKIEGARIEMNTKANEHGHLFAALHEKDIAEALSQKTGVSVPAELVRLPHPLKTLGEHTVSVAVGDAKAEFVLVVSVL